jgi:hypothetical protein
LQWNTLKVKKLNKERIRKELQEKGECTKADIAKLTKLSVATCNTAINEMLASNEIVKVGQEDIVVGRPADCFTYNKDCLHVLGIYLTNTCEGNNISVESADALGHTLVRKEYHPEVIDYSVLETIIGEMTCSDTMIRSVSIGIPGITHKGIVERCDIDSIVGVDLEGQLQDAFHIDVEVRNDMDFIVYGAYHSVFRGTGNLAAVYFPNASNGVVGSGAVINGLVLRGFTKFAGELSYIADAFGISRQQQITIRSQRDIYIPFIAKILLILIGTIDPEEIVIVDGDLTADELQTIQDICKQVVTEKHIPTITADCPYDATYHHGLMRASLNRLLFPISEPL